MMKQIQHYPEHIQKQVQQLVEQNKLGLYLKTQYPTCHQYKNDKLLYEFVMDYKQQYFKKYQLDKVLYDSKIDVLNNALGMHTYISRVQGNKLKAKNEIRISHLFKNTPEAFLEMLVVHELTHLKYKEHDKAFYKLCTHILPNYHQIELDVRLYMIHLEKFGKLY